MRGLGADSVVSAYGKARRRYAIFRANNELFEQVSPKYDGPVKAFGLRWIEMRHLLFDLYKI